MDSSDHVTGDPPHVMLDHMMLSKLPGGPEFRIEKSSNGGCFLIWEHEIYLIHEVALQRGFSPYLTLRLVNCSDELVMDVWDEVEHGFFGERRANGDAHQSL